MFPRLKAIPPEVSWTAPRPTAAADKSSTGPEDKAYIFNIILYPMTSFMLYIYICRFPIDCMLT